MWIIKVAFDSEFIALFGEYATALDADRHIDAHYVDGYLAGWETLVCRAPKGGN